MVVKYLEACSRLFERGILGHVHISTYPNQILNNMEGYSLFSRWLDSLLENGKSMCIWLTISYSCFSSLSPPPSLPLCTSRFSLFFSLTTLPLRIKEYSITDPTSNKFLSWQTWDLMRRITWYGFKEFCEHFIQQYPGYAVYPLRLNGSAVETIFSQLKFITCGHLSAVNFATARANLITRYSVHG